MVEMPQSRAKRARRASPKGPKVTLRTAGEAKSAIPACATRRCLMGPSHLKKRSSKLCRGAREAVEGRGTQLENMGMTDEPCRHSAEKRSDPTESGQVRLDCFMYIFILKYIKAGTN